MRSTAVLSSQSDMLRVVTPFLPTRWFEALRRADAPSSFDDVPYGLLHGFDMGIHTTLSDTFIPPNHSSALENPDVILNHIANETRAGRYSGPFHPSRLARILGSHFRTAPLGVVPKPNSLEFRVIQDLSYPRSHIFRNSVNSDIDPDLYDCEWGT